MWQAVGIESGTVYATAEYKNEVKRILNDGFASRMTMEDAKHFARKSKKVDSVLPEAMLVIREGERLPSPEKEYEQKIADLQERLGIDASRDAEDEPECRWGEKEEGMLIRLYGLGKDYKDITTAVNEAFGKERSIDAIGARVRRLRTNGVIKTRGARPKKYGME